MLKRLALAPALEHAVPLGSKWDGGKLPIDPVARYLHYEQAYKARPAPFPQSPIPPSFPVLARAFLWLVGRSNVAC